MKFLHGISDIEVFAVCVALTPGVLGTSRITCMRFVSSELF